MAFLFSRQANRYRMGLPVKVRLRQMLGLPARQSKKSLVEEETITENISSHGCYFCLSQRPLLGAEVEMEITLPSQPSGLPETRVRCRGRVIRVETAATGDRVGVASSIDHFRLLPGEQ
ncbi:MAG: PilZ domain-containing protein [Acidobacteria bacterium]|nr:PilZ domain-containing protein [Acidobacteriota bacterium]